MKGRGTPLLDVGCRENKWLMSSGRPRDGETNLSLSMAPSACASLTGSAFSLLFRPLPHSLILSCLSGLAFFLREGEAVSSAAAAVGTAAASGPAEWPVMAATSSPSSFRLRLSSSSRAFSARSFLLICFSPG